MAVALTGCGGGSNDRADGAASRPSFAATIHPLAAVMREIAGDRADVVRLLPPGASPHTFEPRPSDVRAAAGALALFHVSDDLDGWAARLDAKERVATLAFIPPSALLPLEEHEHHHGDGHDHDHAHDHAGEGESIDAHYWLDPLLVADALPALAKKMGELDPAGAADYVANADRFAGQLRSLHEEVGTILEPVRGRAVLLFHPSMQYLLHRHGLRMAGSIEPFPGKEPSPRQLQRLARLIQREEVGAVFMEPQFPEGLATSLVEAANKALAERKIEARVVLGELDPIGGASGRESYAELIRFNARSLRDALSDATLAAKSAESSSSTPEESE